MKRLRMLRDRKEVAPATVMQTVHEPADFEAPSLTHLSRPKTAHVDTEPSPHRAGRHTNKLRRLIAAGKPAQQDVSGNLLDFAVDEPDYDDKSFVFVAKTFDPHQLLLDLADLHNAQKALNVVHVHSIERFIEFLHADQTWAMDSEQVHTIESIVCLINDITCTMFYDLGSGTLQVLAAVRYCVRILVKLCDYLTTTTTTTVLSQVMCDCSAVLYQLCSEHTVMGEDGLKRVLFVLPESNWAPLSEEPTLPNDSKSDAGDAPDDAAESENVVDEEESEHVGGVVNYGTNSGSTILHTTGDLVGVLQLNALLTHVWSLIDRITTEQSTQPSDTNTTALHALLHTVANICCVYRCISADETDCRWLSSAGVLSVLVEGLNVFTAPAVVQYICTNVDINTTSTASTTSTTFTDCIVQVLLMIRSFTLVESCCSTLLHHNTVPTLFALLGAYTTHNKVVLHCMRVVYRLSDYASFQGQISANDDYIAHMVNIVLREAQCCREKQATMWPGQYMWSTLSMVCYTLANLTSTDARNRALIGRLGLSGAQNPLLTLIAHCAFQKSPAGDSGIAVFIPGVTCGVASEMVDVTTKMVRLLTNLCMDRNIGQSMVTEDGNGALRILGHLAGILPWTLPPWHNTVLSAGMRNVDIEELTLNTIAACSNLTFYYTEKFSGMRITNNMMSYLYTLYYNISSHLQHANAENRLETVRVFGNLTRFHFIQDSVLRRGQLNVLVPMLHHGDMEVVTAAAGVFVNLSANDKTTAQLLQHNVLEALLQALETAGLTCPAMSMLLCQVLNNLLRNQPDRVSQRGVHSALSNTITQLNDNVSAFDGPEWVQFRQIADVVLELTVV